MRKGSKAGLWIWALEAEICFQMVNDCACTYTQVFQFSTNRTLLFFSEPAPASLSLAIFHGFRRGSLHFGSILKFERQLHPRLYYFEDEFSLAKTLLILVVVLVLAV